MQLPGEDEEVLMNVWQNWCRDFFGFVFPWPTFVGLLRHFVLILKGLGKFLFSLFSEVGPHSSGWPS